MAETATIAAPFDPFEAAQTAAGTPAAPGREARPPDLIPIFGPNGEWRGYERPPGWQPPAQTSPEGVPGGTDIKAPAAAPEAIPGTAAGAAPAIAPPSPGTPAPAATTGSPAGGGAPAAAMPDPFEAAGYGPAVESGKPAAGATGTAGLPQQEVREQPFYQGLWDAVHTIGSGLPNSIIHGATVGFDELVAPLPIALYQSLVHGEPFTQAYDTAVREMRQPRKQFEQDYPTLGTIAEGAGSLATLPVAGPLFAGARAAGTATSAIRAVDAARNVAASAGLGATAGFGMTEGDLGKRVEGAKQGAILGGALGAAAPAVVAAGRGAVRAMTPTAQVPRLAGQILHEQSGEAPVTFQPSPTPGVPLNVAESSGNPELASLVDRRYAENTALMKRHRSEQNQALLAALPRRATTAAPEQAAAEASAAATEGVGKAAQVIAGEEKRLWNKPSLLKPNVSTVTVKQKLEAEVHRMVDEEPGLSLAIKESPRLRQIIGFMYGMPAKAAANQINAVSSRFRKIARDYTENGDVRHIATRLANAVQEGVWEAPEVAGRAPVSASELAAAEQATANAGAQLSAAAATGPARVSKPQSLLDFLIQKGGLKPHGDLSAMNAEQYHHRQAGRLVQKNGLSLDYAREAAAEAGFIKQGGGTNELLNAISDELAGRPVFRADEAAVGEAWKRALNQGERRAQAMEHARDQVLRAEAEAGAYLTQPEVDHAVEMMANDPHMHPADAMMQAVKAREEDMLQRNANALGEGGAGEPPPSAFNTPAPDLKALREGVPPDPDLVRDLKAARTFTKREATVLGHASFDNILRRNSAGNETVVPGTAMNKFFDFGAGVERPGAIKNVVKFLDDVRSEWLKLSGEEAAGLNPAAVQQVRDDLVNNSRDFIIAKMLGRVSGVGRDMTGERAIQAGQMAKWLETNRRLMERAGVFTADQLDALQRMQQTAQMIQRGAELGRPVGSPTYTRAFGSRWLDAFVGALGRYAGGAAIGGTIGGTIGHFVGEGAIGALIGAEGGALGVNLLERLYLKPHAELARAVDEALQNTNIAKDLMRRSDPATAKLFHEDTKRWLRSVLAIEPAAQAGRLFSDPLSLPAPAH